MGQPVVHFEIIGQDPARLRGYFGALFGWQFDTSGLVSEAISQPDDYGFTEPGDDSGIPGGVGGGRDYDNHVIFYVGVPDVEAALQQAESLGGRRLQIQRQAANRRRGQSRIHRAHCAYGQHCEPHRRSICEPAHADSRP